MATAVQKKNVQLIPFHEIKNVKVIRAKRTLTAQLIGEPLSNTVSRVPAPSCLIATQNRP